MHGLIAVLLLGSDAHSDTGTRGYGLARFTLPRAYLHMARRADAPLPARLSETGIYRDLRTLVPAAGLIPYELNVTFWSDGARKSRLAGIPRGKTIGFSPTGAWQFPDGAVFVKTFEMVMDERQPERTRRLETRVLVRDDTGGVYGVVYKWRADGSDADLLPASETEELSITRADGTVRTQQWYYPSRKDCLECHTANAGGVLGVSTRQLNRSVTYPSKVSDNQLRAWNHLGLFSPRLREADIADYPALADPADASRSIEDRARSYLDANCAHCHRPGGTVASFDARYDTPLGQQGLIDGPVLINERIDRARVIAPNDIWRSIAFMRVNTDGALRMPPLARGRIDESGVALLREWIGSLPGRAVVPPPLIKPESGTYRGRVAVTLSDADPEADIHYTVDGSAPTQEDPRYQGAIEVDASTVVRARAFRDGFTRSIESTQIFVIDR